MRHSGRDATRLGVLALLLAGRAVAQDPEPVPAPPAPPAPLTDSEREEVTKAVLDLGHEQIERRSQAIEFLARYAPRITAELRGVLRHQNAAVRLGGVRILQRMPVADLLPTVADLLRDSSAEVREDAVLLYGKMAVANDLTRIADLLSIEHDQRVLRQALAVLGGSGLRIHVPTLLDFMERASDPYLIKKCGMALRSLTGKTHGENLAAWRAWWREEGEGTGSGDRLRL
jgi:hypothetical protein